MLTLHGNHPDTLWDHLLPPGVRALPADLARLDDEVPWVCWRP